MEYLIFFVAGFIAGYFVSWKFGAVASADVAKAKDTVAAVKQDVAKL